VLPVSSRAWETLVCLVAAVSFWGIAFGTADAAYPQTKPIKGTLCAAKHKGKVALTKDRVKVKCVPVTRYQWKVVPR
jgi:hypothetical protein